MTIPSVSSGELIEAAWGNTVANEVNNDVIHRTGGTMTGALVLNLGPTNDLHAARKSYVDNQITGITDDFLPRSGGSMTGQIQLPGDPTLNAHAARKAYVDAMGDARVRIGGDTMTGVLVVGNVPANGDNGARLTNAGLIAGSTNTADAPSVTLIRYGGAGAAGQRFVSFQRDAAQAGSIALTDATHVAYNESSDHRLKERFGAIGDAAERIQQLARRTYRGQWKGGSQECDLVNADDIATVAPYAVTGEARRRRVPTGRLPVAGAVAHLGARQRPRPHRCAGGSLMAFVAPPPVVPGTPIQSAEWGNVIRADLLDLDGRAVLLDTYVRPSAWTNLPLASGWVAYAAGLAVPAFSTDRGRVWLRGTVKRSGGTTGGVTTILTFATLRPALNVLFSVARTTNNTPTARVDVLSNGDVTFAAANSNLATNDGISLDGISWRVDA